MNCVIKAKGRDAYFIGFAQRLVPVFTGDAFRATVFVDDIAAEKLSKQVADFIESEVVPVERKDFP